MKYTLRISKIEYGSVEVEADSPQEAVSKAHDLAERYYYAEPLLEYGEEPVFWYDDEISDVSIDRG